MYIEYTADGAFHFGFGAEDASVIRSAWHKLVPDKNEMLSIDMEGLRHSYRESDWISPDIPYEQLASASDLSRKGWLTIHWLPDKFELPIELLSHRDAMVSEFNRAGRLRMGAGGVPQNQSCPRVAGFSKPKHAMTLQRAAYSDQLATNLCLDFRLHSPLNEFGPTIREMDKNFVLSERHLRARQLDKNGLRPFGESFLANTLGVACLIVFKGGETLYRVRDKKTAIYGKHAHVPVSFAQEAHMGCESTTTLEQLVMQDLPLEFNQETRLEFSTFIDRVEPLGLFRDLERAGKPQLFLKLNARVSVQDFIDAMALEISAAPVREYKSQINVRHSESGVQNMSVELAAALFLLGG